MSSAAQLKAITTRTSDAPARETVLQDLLNRPFDPDAWHAMDERDNALLRDEILHGASSKAFVYEFDLDGKKVTGVSVIGARELASQYKGIKSKIVATIEKRGAMFIFRTFTPLSIVVQTIDELASETDFYECVMEVDDIKTGNSIQVRKKETRLEQRSARNGGGSYERKHFDVIAESKAFRNGVLSLLPQSVVQEFKKKCLAAGNSTAEETIDQIRAKALAHAAKNGIALNRNALFDLTYAEIAGLGAAAKAGVEDFKRSCQALNLTGGAPPAEEGGAPPAPPAPPPAPPAPAAKRGSKAQQADPAAAQPAKKTYAEYADMVLKAGDADSAAVFLDQARSDLDEQLCAELAQVYRSKWEAA